MIKGVKHMRPDDSKFATVPVGKLGIIVTLAVQSLERESTSIL